MLTGRGRGTLGGQLVVAQRWVDGLRADGLQVVRVKIEAAPWGVGIPGSDAEAGDAPAGRYFEHHVKVLLDTAELGGLTALAEPYGAHVSRNARRTRLDGRHERFITQRCYRVGQPTARRHLAGLRAALDRGGYHVLEVEEEYVVYDDNPAIDAGWITSPRP